MSELSKEDYANVFGSFMETALDFTEHMNNESEKKDKEIERLNNIINGFDKWLDEESEKTIYSTGHLTSLLMCKNKLQELKEGEKSEKN